MTSYLYCPVKRGLEGTRSFDPREPDLPPELRFPSAVLLDLAGALDDGTTVVVTKNVDALPVHGPQVVVWVLVDELAVVPRYTGEVAAVLKAYGTDRPVVVAAGPLQATIGSALSELRIQALRMAWTTARFGRPRVRARGIVCDVPLGFYQQVAVEPRPVERRSIDVFFAGSVQHELTGGGARRLAKRVLGDAKRWSRVLLLEAMEALRRARPDLTVETWRRTDFSTEGVDEAYSEAMADAKVCLCPRGSSLETYRLFEAVRAGCVPVHEPLPRRWYYEGLPGLEVRDWRSAGPALAALLDDADRIGRLHREALSYWESRLSEAAVAGVITGALPASLHRAAG
jgi:hypothetical protein